ncbi:MAG: hypothetical protein PHS44_05120 [Candidatus Dojkabacteria bacterium]|nr:hypothetical protein [Candidatus Dojkabacteria bacterium]
MGRKKKLSILISIIIFTIVLFLVGRYVRGYDFDTWVMQTWGYTAVLINPFSVYTINLANSGVSNYLPLANMVITLESLISLTWDIFVEDKGVALNTLSESFNIIHKIFLGVIHLSFGVFLLKKVLKNINDEKIKFVGYLMWILNPVAIINGPIWGQVDGALMILMLSSSYFLVNEKFALSAIFLAFVTLFKFQGIIFIPIYLLVFFLKIYSKNGFKNNKKFWNKLYEYFSKIFFVFGIVFIACSVPYLLYNPATFVEVFKKARIFPFVHMRGFNLWMLNFGDQNSVLDSNIMIGNLSYHAIGTLFFLLLVINIFLIAALGIIKHKKDVNFLFAVEIIFLVHATLFLFLTEVHERFVTYLYIPYLVVFILRITNVVVKKLDFLIWGLVTLIASFNMLYILYERELELVFPIDFLDIFIRCMSLLLILFYIYSLFVFSKGAHNT